MASRTRPRFAPLFALTLATGCFSDPGDGGGGTASASTEDDGTEDPTGDGDGDPGDGDGDPGDGDGDPGDGDGDTGGEACASGFSCVPEPGPAWSGPFAIADTEEECAGAYPTAEHALFAGLTVGATSCACSCGEPEVNCSTNMAVIGFNGLNCVDGQGQQPVSQNQCYNTFAASHGLSLGAASASCGPGEVSETLPEPSFDSALVSCGGASPSSGSCEAGELCVPVPDTGSGICYASEGDVTCPAGYPDKSVYFTSLEDTRSCPEACSCSASGASCRVSVTGFASPNCASAQGAINVDSGAEECVAANSAIVESIRPGNVTVQNAGSCMGSDPDPSGALNPAGELTVCCRG